MPDWIYDRQVSKAEKHWRNQLNASRRKAATLATVQKKTAKKNRRKPKRGNGMIVRYLAPPYADVHPIPEDIQAQIDAGELR